MLVRILLLSAALVCTAAAAPPAGAQHGMRTLEPNWATPTQYRGDEAQNIRSSREIVAMLRARFGGELVSLRLEEGGRPLYLIRWRMPDGEHRDFRVDAVSGQIR